VIYSNEIQGFSGEERNMAPTEFRTTKNRNRGRLEIMYSIIDIAKSEVGKTRIMYGAVLSYDQLSRYLPELTVLGLIEEVSSKRNTMFRATEKGRAFLQQYDRLAEIASGSENETYNLYQQNRL
jgi:predicted transcriptional regulator